MSKPLTQRQRQVLDFLQEFISTRGKPPTLREIQAHFGFGSSNSATTHLAALQQKGWISRVPGESRNIVVLSRCSNRSQSPAAV